MHPETREEAINSGWMKLTKEEVQALKGSANGPMGGLEPFALNDDCNFKIEGAPCGGFGDTIKCFCHNGLCECYQKP